MSTQSLNGDVWIRGDLFIASNVSKIDETRVSLFRCRVRMQSTYTSSRQSSYVPFVWPVQTQTTHLKIHFGGTLQNELQIASTGARQGSSPGARPWQYPIYRMSVKLTYTQAMFVLMHTLGRLFIHFQYSLGWFVQIRFLNDEAHDRRRRRGATWFHSPIVHLLITRPVLIETMFALIGIVDTKQPFILFCTFYFGWSIRFPFWWSMLESISGY